MNFTNFTRLNTDQNYMNPSGVLTKIGEPSNVRELRKTHLVLTTTSLTSFLQKPHNQGGKYDYLVSEVVRFLGKEGVPHKKIRVEQIHGIDSSRVPKGLSSYNKISHFDQTEVVKNLQSKFNENLDGI